MKATETRTPTATTNGNQGGARALAVEEKIVSARNAALAAGVEIQLQECKRGKSKGMLRITWPHWREATRKGEHVVVSPDGARVYRGTAKEVRDAAVLPRRRNELANKLRFRRQMAEKCGDTPEGLADIIRKERREAISRADSDASNVRMLLPMTEADYVQLNAGARLLGQTFEEYWDGVIEGLFDALLDVAESKTGKREIPLTRHEKAALERLRETSEA